jgi:myo-inositol 2-dehydrogenase / D-chiro-inositol 1-dehydrogenase
MTPQRAPGAATDRVRLGILGLGAVAQAVHLPLIERLPDAFEIHAIADVAPSLIARIGEHYQVPPERRHLSLEDLLGTPDLDALMILTSGSHAPAVLAGLAQGLAVFAEKPLAYTLAEADAIAAKLAADPGGKLQVGYMKLYDPAVVHALAEARRQQLGDVRAIEVTVLHPTSEAQLAHARLLPPPSDVDPALIATFEAATDALRRAALGPEAGAALGPLYTNILLGSVVHELALVRAFAADPISIDAVAVWPAATWPPSVELSGRLPDDGRVSIRWHFLPDYPAYREEVRVVYGDATSELSFPSPYLLHRPTELRLSTTADGGRRDEVWTSTVEAFEEELLAFRAFVVDGTVPAAGVREGRADIVTCQRAIATLAGSMGIPVGGEAALGEAVG